MKRKLFSDESFCDRIERKFLRNLRTKDIFLLIKSFMFIFYQKVIVIVAKMKNRTIKREETILRIIYQTIKLHFILDKLLSI